MTHEPLNPKSRNPASPRSPEDRLGASDPVLGDPILGDPIRGDPIRDPYPSSRFSSPSQIIVGLVLVIAVVVGLGLLFGTDRTNVQAPQTTQVQPEVQPQAQPAPAQGTDTSTN